jgi:hypothetical protein
MASIALRPEILGPVPWWKRWRRLNRFRRAHRYNNPDYLKTLLGFSSLYGWSTSDSAIWEQLDDVRAEGLLRHLESAWRAQSALQGRAASFSSNAEAIPSIHDLSAALSDSDPPAILSFIKKHAQTRRWPVAWNSTAFLFAPLTAIHFHMIWLTILWFAVAIYLPIKIEHFGFRYPYDTLLSWLCFCGVLCLHGWVGAYRYRGHIWYAQRLIRKADRLQIFHPELRRTYLMGMNPDQHGSPKPQWRTARNVVSWVFWAIAFWFFVKAALAMLVLLL